VMPMTGDRWLVQWPPQLGKGHVHWECGCVTEAASAHGSDRAWTPCAAHLEIAERRADTLARPKDTSWYRSLADEPE
jgi:hypothetical protein